MESGGREQRFVFGEAAELYDRVRAGYPATLVDDVLGFAGGDGVGLRALEVGAGTGKATVAFAARGVEILALEPSAEMASVLLRKCRAFPMVRIASQTFEEWPVEPGAFGLLFAAQSMHWVDPAMRWVKVAQALQDGGTVALMGHHARWHGEPLHDELEDVYGRLAPDLLHNPGFPGLRGSRDDEPGDEIRDARLFGEVTARSYPWTAHLTAEGLVDVLATQSDHRLLGDVVRERLFDGLRGLVAAHGGKVAVPQVTLLTMARLVGQ